MSSSSWLSLTRENALQGDGEVEYQERLHVQVGLTTANGGKRARLHRHQTGRRAIAVVDGAEKVVVEKQRRSVGVCGLSRVHMRRDLGDREGVGLLAAALPEGVTASHVNGSAALKIGQPKIHAAVTAVRRAE